MNQRLATIVVPLLVGATFLLFINPTPQGTGVSVLMAASAIVVWFLVSSESICQTIAGRVNDLLAKLDPELKPNLNDYLPITDINHDQPAPGGGISMSRILPQILAVNSTQEAFEMCV